MGFLKKLFGGEQKPYEDKQGIYLYVVCDRCDSRLRVRIDKQYDLNRESSGYVWHKTLMDSKCFRQMPTVVRFDSNYEVVEAEIEGGRYLSEAEYKAAAQAESEKAADGTDDARDDERPEEDPAK